ncbi:unnamed protein product [Parnassius apollo]|uniref:(apollo) hypothetical protein n=1 Tax=Parnassius apollo TaxID=110799 RepID=A0A8S3XUB2_PARAO|nr:unnamed protein product [Parnassius apollo]
MNPDVISGQLKEALNRRILQRRNATLVTCFRSEYMTQKEALQHPDGVVMICYIIKMAEFRKLWDPWDEPNLANYRPLQERQDRHVLFINPHWSQYNSLLPIPRIPEQSISILSPAYQEHPWMLPLQNRPPDPKEENEHQT